jgi:hypothetical protein
MRKPEQPKMNPTDTYKVADTCCALRMAWLVAIAALACMPMAQAQASDTPSEPTGFARIVIAAGSGTAKKTTLMSIPLLEDVSITGKSTGRITGVGANTITVGGAGWSAGQLATPAAPYVLEMTSGAAQGRLLLLSTVTANTADTVTIDAAEAARVGDLRQLGLVAGAENGDSIRIRAADTLGSFFGTPETTGILGGSSANTADTVTLVANGSAVTYFYNTASTPARWSRVGLGGGTDASNLPIPPYAGVQYARLGAEPLSFLVTGRMPAGVRKVAIKNAGTTLLSPYWPVSQTLSALGLHNLPGWVSSTTIAAADTVVLTSGGSVTTYYHDGNSWRRVGLGAGSSDAVSVPVGASVLINKKGTAPGFTTYEHTAPYSLQ